MRSLTATELLDVWEAGSAQTSTGRALALLAAAWPDTPREALAALSIGQRDARLLMLREALWGPEMAAVMVCPSCRERLDLPLNTRELLSKSPPILPGEIPLSVAEYTATFRLPTSLDVITAGGQSDIEGSCAMILNRCLLSVQKGGVPVQSVQLPSEVIETIAKGMADADPLADIQLDVKCPACGHLGQAIFDIVSFLWTEIEIWAWRMLSDVHVLASAYGWCEREILGLSSTRRQFYLEMVGA